MRMSKMIAGVFMAATLAPSGAQAVENGVMPANPGTEGMQNLNIPPPGLYVVNYTNWFHASQINDQDGNEIKGIDANIDFLVNAVRFLNYADVARFGDSRVGILSDVAIPFGHVDASVGGVSGKQTGLADISINPLSVYYKKGDWLNLGFSPTFTFLPTGRWEREDPASLGRNYASWQPTIAYTMIFFDKLDVSGRFRYVHNFTNNDGAISAVNPTGANYESGDMIAYDFSVGYALTDKLQLSLNGYYVAQLEDDKIHGDRAANAVLQDVLDGGRSSVFALGPAIGYDVGIGRVYAHWQHQFEGKNTAQGDSIWLRFATRIWPY